MITDLNINIDDLEELDTKPEEILLNDLREELDDSSILIPNYNNNGLNGEFKDDLWVFESELNKVHITLDFSDFEEFRFLGLQTVDITRIKTFFAYLLLTEDNDPSTIRTYHKGILDFFKKTDFMNNEHLSYLTQLVREELNKSDKAKPFSVYAAAYLNFIIDKLHVQDPNLLEFRKFLSKANKTVKLNTKSRTLPTSQDIMTFHHCVETFFSDEEVDDNLKLLYKPIHIWWKLTNIIPMRPSEFCVKLERDCIIHKDEKYFIKINRVKEKHSNRFPILKEIEISEELALSILRYIEDTNKFGPTNTLFSFRALSELRTINRKQGHKVNNNMKAKIQTDFFTRNTFGDLLDSFYYVIIGELYNIDSYERKLKPGDTRHFAFFSLLMQGVSPVEIALLGGHSTLEMQVNYQNCIEYYIGTELYEFLYGKKDETEEKIYKSLNEIINSLPKVCPKPLEQRLPLKVGYCLCDFDYDECDDVIDEDFCCFCSKWWGEPTRITYDQLKLQIEDELKTINKDNFYKLSALEELISRNYIQRTYGSSAEGYVETKTTINALRSNCSRLIGLKTSLMVDDYLKNIGNRKEFLTND